MDQDDCIFERLVELEKSCARMSQKLEDMEQWMQVMCKKIEEVKALTEARFRFMLRVLVLVLMTFVTVFVSVVRVMN